MSFFNRNQAAGQLEDRSQILDQKNPNALIELLTGRSPEQSQDKDLELIEQHGVMLHTKQIVGMTSLSILNEKYQDPYIAQFIDNWIELQQYTKPSVKNLMKTIEYKENKRFTENLNVGMKLNKQ